MNKARRTRITVETTRVTLVAENPASYCPECREYSAMIRLEEAAVLFSISTSAICGLLEAGRIHSASIAPDQILVCVASLGAAAGTGGPLNR